MIEAALRHGAQSFEWTQRRVSGEEFPATVRLTRAESDCEVLLLANVRDDTEARDLLASVAQSERLVSMGMLAAGIANEINNPLTSVLYDVESLAEDLPDLADARTGSTDCAPLPPYRERRPHARPVCPELRG